MRDTFGLEYFLKALSLLLGAEFLPPLNAYGGKDK